MDRDRRRMPRIVAEESPPPATSIVRSHDEPAFDDFRMHARAVRVDDIDRLDATLYECDVGGAADLELVKRHERVMLAAGSTHRGAGSARQCQPREQRSHRDRREDNPGKRCVTLRRRIDRHVDWMRPPRRVDSPHGKIRVDSGKRVGLNTVYRIP